jgi:hypothetical protein
MNERIQELAKKSGLLGRKFMFGQYYDDELTDEQKKFAELLVKECAMIVEGFEITQEVALDEYVDYEASAVLKEHFGVES